MRDDLLLLTSAEALAPLEETTVGAPPVEDEFTYPDAEWEGEFATLAQETAERTAANINKFFIVNCIELRQINKNNDINLLIFQNREPYEIKNRKKHCCLFRPNV